MAAIELSKHCELDLVGSSINVIKDLQNGDPKSFESSFYSKEFFEEINVSDDVISIYIYDLGLHRIGNFERIIVENKRIGIESENIPGDSVDVTRVYIPLEIKKNPAKPERFFMMTYLFEKDVFKLIGTRLFDPSAKETTE